MPRKLVLRMFPRVPPIFRILGKQLARLLAIHSEHEIAFFIFIFHLLFMFKLTYAGLGCSTRGAVLEQSISQSVSQSVIASDQAQWIESMHSTSQTRRSLCDTKLIVNIPGKSHQKLSVQFSFFGKWRVFNYSFGMSASWLFACLNVFNQSVQGVKFKFEVPFSKTFWGNVFVFACFG